MLFTVIDHKNDIIKWSKQSEQSIFSFFMGDVEENFGVFLLMFFHWEMSKRTLGFTILFRCGIFRFNRLKCHRYMLENL